MNEDEIRAETRAQIADEIDEILISQELVNELDPLTVEQILNLKMWIAENVRTRK